jgi:hypothetical protein
MTRILLTALFFIVLAAPAFACSPPEMPTPPAEIAALYNLSPPRTPEQQARLDEYQADQDRIMLIWSQLYPCLDEVNTTTALTPEEKQALEQALETEEKAFTKKWTPEEPHAD